MTIEKQITQIETLIEQYEDSNNPEDRMDFKQRALKEIKSLRAKLPLFDFDKEELETTTDLLDEFEEVLSY